MKSKAGDKIFDVMLLLLCGTAIVMSFSYNATARVFPLYFGLVAFVFILLHFIVSNMKNPPKYLRFISQKGVMSDIAGESDGEKAEDELPWKQIMKVVLWLIGYIIALAFINYLIATLIFLILFLRIAGEVPLLKTSLISVIFCGFLYFLFEIVL